jgi:hypothetical protein
MFNYQILSRANLHSGYVFNDRIDISTSLQGKVYNDALSVIMESANFNLDIGDNAKIDIGQAVDYIKSGEAEIEAAVQTKTAAFNLNA